MKYVTQEGIVNPTGKTDHQFVKFQNNKLTLKLDNIDNKFNLTTGSDKYNRSRNNQQKNVIELRYDHDIAASSSENVHINTTPLRLNAARRSHNISSFTQIPNILNNQDIREAVEDKQIFQSVISHNNSKVINNNVSVRGGSRIEKNKKINVMINNNDISIQPNYHTRNLNSKSMPGNSEHTKILEIQTGSQNIKKLNSSRNRHKIDMTNNDTLNRTSPISTISELMPKTRNIQRAKAVSTIRPTFKSITLPFVTSRTILKSTSSQRPTVNVEMKRNISVGKTSRQNNQSRRASKEDFFNRGLGFRGRTPSISRTEQGKIPAIITSTTTTPISAITFKTENTAHGNPGWTLRRRPGHWRANSSSPVIFNSVEIPTLVQTNKINSTKVSISKTMRRGNKTFAKITDGRIKEEFSEIDNYPPEFKARISQLQKTDIHMRSSLNVNKVTALELFATRSKIKLDNARKLVKPELLLDETNTHQEIVNPLSKYIHIRDQNIRKLKDDEDQNTLKNMQKLILFTERSRWYQTTSMKSNWETSKLKKDLQDSQTRFSRYKQTQLYTVNSKIPSNNIISTIEKSTDKNIYKNKATNSTQLDQYQEHKYKLISKLTENKFRGPKSSQIEDKFQDKLFPTTKLSIIIKPRKILGLSKNDKSYVEDVKVIALKFRKSLESIEKSQIHKLVKKNDSMDGPTTLLTTMRTIKSFSFSTRLAKMDNTNSISSSTMKIFENQMPPALILSSTFPSFDTKTVMQNFTEHEMDTSAYNNILTVHDSLSLKTNNFFTKKAHAKGEMQSDWNVFNNTVNSTISHDKSSAAALVNYTDSTVFVVYPSAIEKPLSIAITPKSFENQTTVKPEGELLSQQLSVTQKPIINGTVWSSNDSNSTTFLQESLPHSQNIIFGNTKSTNIFNPSKSTAIFKTGNNTILEYLRSTVAPLWSTRGFQSPAVSNIYKNSNSVNSLSRLIPKSALSKFSARYKGTELYLRRPTPTNFSLSQHNDSTTQINVMNAENSQISTLYQSTNITNNEKTDVRQLWVFGKAIPISNVIANNPFNAMNSNNNVSQIMPVTISSIVNDTHFSYADNKTTVSLHICIPTPFISSVSLNNIDSISNLTENSIVAKVTPIQKELNTFEQSTRSIGIRQEPINITKLDILEQEKAIIVNNTIDEISTFALINDSNNIASTNVPTVIESNTNFTTVSPIIFNHFQDPTFVTAQRTAKPTISENLKNIHSKMISSTIMSSAPTLLTNIPNSVKQTLNPNIELINSSTSRPIISFNSSTNVSLRDYLIYGIYPNKTIVRKRPENNLIYSRNINSPYVIFGVYPNGKLVRKFPNGTLIPDPTCNPVEIVFSLEANTTKKPHLFNDQANSLGVRNRNTDISNKPKHDAAVNTQNSFNMLNEVDNTLGISGLTGFDLPVGSIDSDSIKTIAMVTSSTLPDIISSQQDRHIIDSYQSKDEYQHDRISENKGQRNSVSLQQDGSNIQNLTASVRPVKNMIEILNPISSTINSLIDTPKKTTRATIISVPKIESPTIPATTRVTTPTALSPIMENLKTMITEASVMTHTPIISSEELFSTIESPVTLNPNAFGNTFDDLSFLNTLILSLVLGRTLTNSASFRSPKAIQLSNVSPNSYQMNTPRKMAKMSSSLLSSSSQPTVIGLVPLSTTKLPGIESTMPYTWKPIRTFSGYKQSSVISMGTVTPSTMPMTSMTTSRVPKMSKSLNLHFTSTSKTLQSMLGHLKTMTTSASANINNMPKTTKRFKPSTTSKVPLFAPLAFATNFLRTIFGSNPFALKTTRPMIKKSASTLKTLSPTAQNITTVASRSTVISIESVERQNNSKSIDTSTNVLTNIQGQTDTIYNTVFAKEMTIVTPMPTITEQSPAIYSSKDDTKFLSTFLQITQNMNGSSNEPAMKSQFNDQIIEPSTPINLLNEQLQQSNVGKAIQSSTARATTISTRTTTKWRSSSWTYPSPLFGNFDGLSNGSSLYQDKGLVRNQVLNAAISMTQTFGKFLGATITGAAQQFQWFIRNGTRWG
ncbi:PREDICTED: mucin-3A-like [Ceratosolen solmsi marchali]|uniref:Mucin-3A-like n=1 Tax=Ceratosolen solmsi marchali TaxID=326594 RepID=A0AAJ6YST1_9HYME|nr:PREDICTED: mucin-3A-like [Ceratosolen solmsi marchali]